MQNKRHKALWVFMLLSSYQAFSQAKQKPPQKQEVASIVAFLGANRDPITTIDIENYKWQLGNPIDKKEILKAILIRRLLLLYARKSPFADIKSLDPATFSKIRDERLSKIDFTKIPGDAVKMVKKWVSQQVEEELLIHLFVVNITANRSATYHELLHFYKQKNREEILPKVEHQVVIQQIICVPKKGQLEKDLLLINKKIYLPLKSKTITFEDAEEIIKNDYPNQGEFKRYYATPEGSNSWLVLNIPRALVQKFHKPISQWEVGEVSRPHVVKLASKRAAIRIFYIKRIIRASLQDDYETMLALVLKEKKQKMLNQWIKNKCKKLVMICSEEYTDILDEL